MNKHKLYKSIEFWDCWVLQMYYHGEEINISVDIDNSSNRNMKDLSVSGAWTLLTLLTLKLMRKCVSECFLCFSVTVEQVTNVVLYSNDKYIKTVAYEETGWVPTHHYYVSVMSHALMT